MVVEYDECFVSYFDILGFKDMVKEKSAEDIYSTLSEFNKSINTELGGPVKGIIQKYFFFSDTGLRITRLEGKNRSANDWYLALINEIAALMAIQTTEIKNGVLLSGAVTYGKIKYDDSVFFGPSLIRAYYINEKTAHYPRIIIDKPVYDKFILNHKNQNPSFTKPIKSAKNGSIIYRDIVKRSEDQQWFINYLYLVNIGIVSPERFDLDLPVSILKNHKLLIEKNIGDILEKNKNKTNKRIDVDTKIIKYGWLINYHDNSVNSYNENYFVENGIDRDDLLINKEIVELIDRV